MTALVPLLSNCNLTITEPDSTVEHREPFAFTKPVAARNELSISNINGNITVTGVDTLNEVRISGAKIGRDETLEEDKQRVGEIRVDIIEPPTMLSIKSSYPNNESTRQYRVDYEIHVPSSWRVVASNVNGAVSILNIKNRTKTTITSGTLDAKEIVGDLGANRTNGSITANMTLPLNALCALETLSGTITLTVPRTTSAEVSASAINGAISVSNLPLVLRTSSRTFVTGTLRAGQGTIRLSTLNGTMTLTGF